ncbi:unnamed protein product [Musa banksii]
MDASAVSINGIVRKTNGFVDLGEIKEGNLLPRYIYVFLLSTQIRLVFLEEEGCGGGGGDGGYQHEALDAEGVPRELPRLQAGAEERRPCGNPVQGVLLHLCPHTLLRHTSIIMDSLSLAKICKLG